MREGDLVAFDTALIHSASPCSNGVPRYAYFSTCVAEAQLQDPKAAIHEGVIPCARRLSLSLSSHHQGSLIP